MVSISILCCRPGGNGGATWFRRAGSEARLRSCVKAMVCQERRNFPPAGMSKTRRVLRYAVTFYRDEHAKALICFACGQLKCARAQHAGHPFRTSQDSVHNKSPSMYCPATWLTTLEESKPGCLLNHLSYDLWLARYGSSGSLLRCGPG